MLERCCGIVPVRLRGGVLVSFGFAFSCLVWVGGVCGTLVVLFQVCFYLWGFVWCIRVFSLSVCCFVKCTLGVPPSLRVAVFVLVGGWGCYGTSPGGLSAGGSVLSGSSAVVLCFSDFLRFLSSSLTRDWSVGSSIGFVVASLARSSIDPSVWRILAGFSAVYGYSWSKGVSSSDARRSSTS